MRRALLMGAVLFVCSVGAEAQRSLASLPSAHASAVRKFLAENPDIKFLSELAIDPGDLKEMRPYLSDTTRKPYYETGDWNRDGVRDFAVVLTRGRAARLPADEVEARRNDLELLLVAFHGKRRGGFEAVHSEDLEVPLTCMIATYQGKLAFGVFESDADTFYMVWKSGKYVMEFDPER